jgi:hypothetical protein
MQLRYTPQERNYLLLALAVLVLGTGIASMLKKPELMPGIGALVIIVGVVFATRNLEELIASRIETVSRLATEFSAVDRINEAEERLHRGLTETEKSAIRKEVEAVQSARHSNRMKATRRRLQFVEAHIVIIGTAVNGWGQPFMEPWLK